MFLLVDFIGKFPFFFFKCKSWEHNNKNLYHFLSISLGNWLCLLYRSISMLILVSIYSLILGTQPVSLILILACRSASILITLGSNFAYDRRERPRRKRIMVLRIWFLCKKRKSFQQWMLVICQ